MEQLKLKDFSRWARREGLTDPLLHQILREMEGGLLGDRLGADLYKKRVALSGRGKRGGARTIVLFKKGAMALFIFGYTKKEKGDLQPQEEQQLRIFAKAFLKLDEHTRESKCAAGALVKLREAD